MQITFCLKSFVHIGSEKFAIWFTMLSYCSVQNILISVLWAVKCRETNKFRGFWPYSKKQSWNLRTCKHRFFFLVILQAPWKLEGVFGLVNTDFMFSECKWNRGIVKSYVYFIQTIYELNRLYFMHLLIYSIYVTRVN